MYPRVIARSVGEEHHLFKCAGCKGSSGRRPRSAGSRVSCLAESSTVSGSEAGQTSNTEMRRCPFAGPYDEWLFTQLIKDMELPTVGPRRLLSCSLLLLVAEGPAGKLRHDTITGVMRKRYPNVALSGHHGVHCTWASESEHPPTSLRRSPLSIATSKLRSSNSKFRMSITSPGEKSALEGTKKVDGVVRYTASLDDRGSWHACVRSRWANTPRPGPVISEGSAGQKRSKLKRAHRC